ncbi:unnamed protein product, partial [Staurois parvus]
MGGTGEYREAGKSTGAGQHREGEEHGVREAQGCSMCSRTAVVRIPGRLAQLCSGTLPVPLYPAACCLPGFCSVGTGHDSRVPSAHAQEAVLFVNGKAVPGTHDRSQKPPDQSQSASASRSMRTGHPAVMPRSA